MRKNRSENVPQGQNESIRERLHLDRSVAAVASIGAAAMAGVLVAGGVTVGEHVEKESKVAVANPNADYEATLLALQKVLVGGNTDSTSHGIEDYLNALGMIRSGDQVHLVQYSANVAEQERSSEEGAARAVEEVNAARSRGEPVMLIGFSLGGDVVARAGQQIAAANGGTLPPDVKIVSYGGPASSTGFWASLPGKVGAPWAAPFGVDMSARLPAGSDEHSDQNDVWGNGANQYLMGTFLQAIATGTGSHRIPGENEPRIDWVDEYGVHHYRYSVGLNPMVAIAKSQNMYMAPGSEQYWNAAANAAFPINDGRDGLPDPNGQALIDNLARAFDVQAGTGNLFFIMSRFIPAPFVQFGLDLVNKVPNAFAEGALKVQDSIINAPQNTQSNLNQIAQVPASVTNPGSVPSVDLNLTPAPLNVENTAPVVDAPEVPLSPAATSPAPEEVAPVNVENNVQQTVNDVAEEVVSSVESPAVPAPAEAVQDVVEQAQTAVQEVVEAVTPPVVESAPVQEAPAPVPVVEAPAPVVVEAPAPAPVPVPEPAPAPVPAPVQEVVQNVVDQVQQALPNLGDVLPAPAQ